ncbi:MAG: S-layer homology domain-containing protein [Actinomycetota bacterium]|nr:S-layer homology domain-containing protein [Actinomycetota bacterium]
MIIMLAAVLAASMIPVAVLAAGGTFTDDEDSIFEADIEWLAGAGVTAGCNPPTNDNFCPDDSVTRGQMAAFMRRFAQFLGAEDGTVSNADHAATADSATTAGDADTLGGLSAEDLIESSPLVIHAADFAPDEGGAYGDLYMSWGTAGWIWQDDSGQCLQAAVPLPNGAALSTVEIKAIDADGDGFLAYHTAPMGDAAVVTPGTSVTSAVVQTVTIDVSGTTASNANHNWIGVCLWDVSDVLYGALVSYTISDASIAAVPSTEDTRVAEITSAPNGS